MKSLLCPACGNYPDTPNHEFGCPGVPNGLGRDGSGERWQLDEGDTGVAILPPIPVTPGSITVAVEPLHVHEWIVEACGCGAVRLRKDI